MKKWRIRTTGFSGTGLIIIAILLLSLLIAAKALI